MMAVGWISPAVHMPQGRQIAMPDEWIASKVRAPKRASAKALLWRWAFVEFRGAYRLADNLLREHALMFDVDDGTTLAQLKTAFADTYTLVHSSFNATESDPRWRVIVMLDRPLTTIEEHDRVWRAVAMRIERVGGRPCYGARSVAHCFGVPGIPPSGYYTYEIIQGAFVDVAEALRIVPPPEPLPELARTERSDSYEHRLERARRYLAAMPGGIQGSGGSTTTFKAALALVRGFGLEPDDALAALVDIHNGVCQPQWSLAELRHKIRQAVLRARVEHGYLADRPMRRSA
jgi:hypothetical protein